jgi:hypothetical protein
LPGPFVRYIGEIPLAFDNQDFAATLKAGELRIELKRPPSEEGRAQARVEPFLDLWTARKFDA